ncbi:MAG: pectinesterase family protein, partial [Oxalobacter formigenes]|nr:pectinesterase family protein [Oxalobacter formigenes]
MDGKNWLLLTVLDNLEVKIETISILETKKTETSGGNGNGEDDENKDPYGDGEDVGDQTWDFRNVEEADRVTIESKTGKYKSLTIDATTGKFWIRPDGDVQINANTVVSIPVDGDCEITVVAYNANYAQNYTLNGESTTEAEHTFTYTGSKGYVELKATGTTYLYSIATKHTNGGGETDPNAGKKKEVAVTVTSGSLVAATDKVVLVNTADVSDAVVVADGKANLTVGGSYIALVQDADSNEKEALTVRINGNRKFAMTSQTTAITVTVTEPKKDAEGNLEATRTTKYDFTKGAAVGTAIEAGKTLPGTGPTDNTSGTSGIYVKTKGSSCKWDSGLLKFNSGTVLYLPILDDTTKITFSQSAKQTQTGRNTYIGVNNGPHYVEMTTPNISITLDDITEYIETVNGQKYLPIFSNADIKLTDVTLTEYNPINTVIVSGKIADAAGKNITSIKFKNLTDEKAELVSAAVKEDGTYTVELKRVGGNAIYVASIPTENWKLNSEGEANQFKLTGNGATATKDFTFVTRALSTVSGTIKGIPDTGVVGEGKQLEVTLVPNDVAADPVKLTLTKKTVSDEVVYEFTQKLEQASGYKVELTNADDYEVKDEVKVAKADTSTVELTATPKATYAVKGNFVTSDDKDAAVTKLTFTNMDTPDYKYTFTKDSFTATGSDYTVQLREGEYETSAEAAEGYTVWDHVSVKAAENAIENDIYLQKPAETSTVEYKETLQVGKGDGKDFEKIADAIAYIARMERTADQRVTIVLDEKGEYREQLVINTPNITIEGNGSKITWYYGVNFSYYSAKLSADGKSAYYDKAYAVDKYYMRKIEQNPGHWGATVNLLVGAKGFAAENLIFENSLNYYVTPEELADGAGANTGDITARADGIDVYAKKAKERACVLYIQADETTYKDCKFLSEQDTVYTGDKDEHSYFVNCTLEGNTDFICGDGNAVFDQCLLSLYAYSDTEAEGSYIVANQKEAKHGYLLKGSKIVSVKSSATQERKAVKNTYLGRAWAAGYLRWIDTEVESADTIIAAGYTDMNEKVKDAHYYEYNTYYLVGDVKTPVDTSKRAEGVTVMTETQAKAVSMFDFFDGWTPLYYEGAKAVGTITVTVTAPTAGGDVTKTATNATPAGIKAVSDITWYEGEATTAYTGDTYKAETTYKAQMTVTIDDGFEFAPVLTAVVEGADSATAVAGADGKTATITATYTTGKEEPKGTLVTLDLTEGLKAGQTYEGGFSVLEDMPRKSATNKIGTETYTFYVAGSTDAKPKGGEIPTSGAALKLVALADGILTVAVTVNGTKALHFVDADDIGANNKPKDYINRGTSVEAGELFELNVVKGHTYYLYGDGTKMKLLAVSILYTGELEPDNPDDPTIEIVSADGWDKNVADPVIGDVTYVKGKSAYG